MNGINLDRSSNVEPGLFEAQRHTSSTSKKINGNRSQNFLHANQGL